MYEATEIRLVDFRSIYFGIACIFMTACLAANATEHEDDHVIEDPGEEAAIAAAAGQAIRNGRSLILQTKAGKVKFEDGKGLNFSDPNFGYALSRYFAGQGFLITAGYANSDVASSFWVSEANGRSTYLDGAPIFSPDGRHFAIISTCDGMGKCILQIWQSDGPKLLFERKPPDNEYEDYERESWHGNKRIVIDIGVNSPEDSSELRYSSGAIVETTPGNWQFDWSRK